MDIFFPPDEISKLSMSNANHSIDEGLAEELKQNEDKLAAEFYGWHFFATVWYCKGLFHAEVKTHGAVRGNYSGHTLEELRATVNDIYGWE